MKKLTLKAMLMGAVMATAASMPASAEIAGDTPGAQNAVKLMGMWVKAGAPNGAFAYTDISGNAAKGTFDADILPLFIKEGIWGNDADGEALPACNSCHSGVTEESAHEMGLGSYAEIMQGGDTLGKPPGISLFAPYESRKPKDAGVKTVAEVPNGWSTSTMRHRLRDNRMPPGVEFDITEENRDGPTGKEVGMVGDWVSAGAKNDDNFKKNILPLFTEDGAWGKDADGTPLPACGSCHSGLTEESAHEMDLTTYEGILAGGDTLGKPPGVSLLAGYDNRKAHKGQKPSDLPNKWGASTLKIRLRDNRMPPGIEFDITEENRDGPVVLHGMN